ncbi:MAG TPA: L,D-transpeptidase, partial [Pseudolabrys sp.]|nr:L,D-transpeptidase [Pseudolabrys sp.]
MNFFRRHLLKFIASGLAVAATQSAQARDVVPLAGYNYSRGSIVISTSARALYYVLGNGQAVRYPVGVGKAGMA